MKSSKRSGELDKVGLSFAKLMQVLGEEKSPLPGSDSGVPDGWRSILNDLKQERDDHLLGSDFSQTSLETEKDFGAMLSDLENHGSGFR